MTIAFQSEEYILDQGSAGTTVHRAWGTTITFHVEGSKPDDPILGNQPLMLSEDFVASYAAPRIAHGRVKGVLEIFFREFRVRDSEWLELLEALAIQGAIVIDNTETFQNLQRTHL